MGLEGIDAFAALFDPPGFFVFLVDFVNWGAWTVMGPIYP